jgi:hypothetical protein
MPHARSCVETALDVSRGSRITWLVIVRARCDDCAMRIVIAAALTTVIVGCGSRAATHDEGAQDVGEPDVGERDGAGSDVHYACSATYDTCLNPVRHDPLPFWA